MQNRVILFEIYLPIWKFSFCVRWMWKWIPELETTKNYWEYEWLCFDVSGKFVK